MKIESTCICGKDAFTTIVQIPACKSCWEKYSKEGRRYLPFEQRVFYKSFIDMARRKGVTKATNYTFSGY
jgi:hypothetical protein